MLVIQLPQSVEKRLESLARRAGRTKTHYVRGLILTHIEDLEDTYAAERVLARVRSGKEKTHTLDEVAKRLGLDD
jgi:RHH-type transcriptional regulator, rel operon repressor / antitoxin RelB